MPSAKKNLTHLHSDELHHVLEYLEIINPTTNLNLSLINKEFLQLTSSDRYWKQILQQDPSIDDHAKRSINTNFKKKYQSFKKKDHLRRSKINQPKGNKFRVLFDCSICMCVCCVVLCLLVLCFYGIIHGSLNVSTQTMCVREIISKERIEMFEVMPENGVCKDCKVYNSSIGNCTWIENKTIPDYYPCCLSESNCTYDRISTRQFRLVYNISNYVTERNSQIFVYPFEIYQCEESNRHCKNKTDRYYCIFDPLSKTSFPVDTFSSGIIIFFGAVGVLVFSYCCCVLCAYSFPKYDRG